MNTTYDNEMTYNPQPPVFRQIAAFVFGLVFAFTNGYSGLQLLAVIICAPLIFAGAIRLYTAVYRFVRPLIAGCVLGEILSVAIAFSAIGVVTSFLLAPAFQVSTALGVILTVALMLCEGFAFIRDLRIWKKNKESNE